MSLSFPTYKLMYSSDRNYFSEFEGIIPEDETERKHIIGIFFEIAVIKIFKTNAYTIKGELRVQEDRAPIGLDLSGEVGRLETGEVDKEINKLCEANNIKVDLAGRYVDDLNNVMGIIPYGYRRNDGEVVFNADWIREDQEIPPDKHTCNIMTDLANSIKPWIQFVVDVGSNYPDHRVPILDMKMKIIHVKVEADLPTGAPAIEYPQVSYNFFKKSMARKTIMAARSAMPEQIKRQTVVNEMLRRLANISRNHPDTQDNIIETVNEFMASMKRSGYGEKVRKETALDAFKGFEGKVRQANEEGKPLHRHK